MAQKKRKEEKKIIFNTLFPEEARAVIATGREIELVEMENQLERGIVGNIYLGEVENVEPALQAAFVNFGGKRNGFLPFTDFFSPALVSRKKTRKRKNNHSEGKVYLRKGDRILIQVVKDESPLKGAVLTSYVSIAGRYLVLMMGMRKAGISKKINDEGTREKIKTQVAKLNLPVNMGIIVRTVGANRKLKELREDLKNLKEHWAIVQKKAKEMEKPGILYAEQDLVTRFLRDHYDVTVSRIVVDTEASYDRALGFFNVYAFGKKSDLFLYKGRVPIFDHYSIEEGVEKIFSNRVDLASGGYLIIDVTEAFITVDVNSGRSVKEKDIEETAYKTNLEAAREIPRQLRLKDLGGIIVMDFIDMENRQHKKEVERAVRAAMRGDRARFDIGPLGKFSVMTMTRQRLGTSPYAVCFEDCPSCVSSGRRKRAGSVSSEFFREILRRTVSNEENVLKFSLSPYLFEYIVNTLSERIREIEEHTGSRLDLKVDFSLRGYSFTEISL
jgi:ribonuclease E